MSTLEEVARLSGVSTATVSRALRGLPNVAPSTRDRVLKIAQELNYSLDVQASRLASGRTMTVGLVLPLADQWFYARLSTAIETILLMEGYDVLRYPITDPQRQTEILRQLSTSNRVDGIIISTIQPSETDQKLLLQSGRPVITIETRTGHFPSITCDNIRAAETVTRHLLNLGHRQIGLISGLLPNTPLEFPVPAQREQGYRNVLKEHDIEVRPELNVPGNFSPAGGAEAMTRLLSVHEPPSAIFALSDEMAIGAVKTIRNLGLRIPEDISVVGFDNHDLAEFLDLTTIHQPVTQYGDHAAHMLLKMLAGGDQAQVESLVLPTRLIVRATTGPHR
jgi:DNA-binding LacI/PurR family transcriptional regulator